MSYEPTLIIRKNDLDKALPTLEKDRYTSNAEAKKVAEYLYNVGSFTPIVFDKLRLVLCTPEHTSFNQKVREKLIELDIDFREDF